MATVNRTTTSAQRAQMMRDVWGRVEQRGSAYLGPVLGFLITAPALAQGVYYTLTGLWPLLSLDTFLAVTGPKTDVWLVQTVGVLISVIGVTLCIAAYRGQVTPEILFLAVGSAAGLAGVDLYFAFQRRISAVYLLDGLVEIGLVALWVYAWQRNFGEQPPPQAVPVPPGANGNPAAAPQATYAPGR